MVSDLKMNLLNHICWYRKEYQPSFVISICSSSSRNALAVGGAGIPSSKLRKSSSIAWLQPDCIRNLEKMMQTGFIYRIHSVVFTSHTYAVQIFTRIRWTYKIPVMSHRRPNCSYLNPERTKPNHFGTSLPIVFFLCGIIRKSIMRWHWCIWN